MIKWLLLFSFIMHHPQLLADWGEVEHQAFIPTAFGIKSRTSDIKDAESVVKLIKAFQLSNPKIEILKIEILTCTSDYQLPQSSVTSKKVNEHLQLAKERHEMIMLEVKKFYPSAEGEYKVCGLEFDKADLNDRFVTQESGEIYQNKFALLLGNVSFLEKLKKEALIEKPEQLKQQYPTPFLAKYKPFQGVRVLIKGRTALLDKHQIKPDEKKSKGAKQE